MIFEQILKTKGTEVICVSSDQTLREAATLLDENRIGSVVATNQAGGIIGVLSERDITRQFARHGEKALHMHVSDAMTRDVITVSPRESIDQGLAKMTDRRIRHLPVCDEDKLIGIVSIGDLVKWKLYESEAEAEAMKQYIATG